MLTLALIDDALDEHVSYVKGKEENGHMNDAFTLIRIVSKRIETPDSHMMIKNKWYETKLWDGRRN